MVGSAAGCFVISTCGRAACGVCVNKTSTGDGLRNWRRECPSKPAPIHRKYAYKCGLVAPIHREYAHKCGLVAQRARAPTRHRPGGPDGVEGLVLWS